MKPVTKQEIVEGLRNCHTTLMLQANPNDEYVTHFQRYVDSLIKRIQAHGIAPPEGWVFVPKEPTAEMIAALGFNGEIHIAIGHADAFAECVEQYKSMLAAAEIGRMK